MIINFNTDGRYDIDMRETDIQFNASFSPKEKSTEDFMNKLFTSTIEAKAQNQSKESFFVEYGMAIPGKDWREEFRPHGILTTESDRYLINLQDEFGLFLSTQFLIWLYNNNKVHRSVKDTNRQNDVGIGMIVYWGDVARLYQEYRVDKRLKELKLRK
jgi:hypothetical protein